MPTYVSLVNFTEKGLHDVKETVHRAEAFKALAKKLGANVKELVWTQGAHDIVAILEAPDAATVSAVMLSVSKLGNVRSQTLQGFTAAEMEKILDKLA
jgi:uncharacterized protein with GYD domain